MVTVDPELRRPAVRAGPRAAPRPGRVGRADAGHEAADRAGLAAELGLAANTVARAYRELEALGVIETRGRAGSVVSGHGVEQAARLAAHEYAEKMRALGIGRGRGSEAGTPRLRVRSAQTGAFVATRQRLGETPWTRLNARLNASSES